MQQGTVENRLSWVQQLPFKILNGKGSISKIFVTVFQEIDGQRTSESLPGASNANFLFLLLLLLILLFLFFFLFRRCLSGIGSLKFRYVRR